MPEKLTGAQARAALARLQTIKEGRPSFVAALERQNLWRLGWLKRTFAQPDWRARLTADQNTVSEKVAIRLTPKSTVLANIKRIGEAEIALQKAPYQPGSRANPPDLDPISRYWSGLEFRYREAEENTMLDLMIVRLALTAYKSERGHYPARLTQLQPTYLPILPTDDFAGGKPYRYALQNGQFRLWSVGPDTIDDGGKALGQSSGGALPDFPALRLREVARNRKGDIVAGEVL